MAMNIKINGLVKKNINFYRQKLMVYFNRILTIDGNLMGCWLL